jgi:hypothetical protein
MGVAPTTTDSCLPDCGPLAGLVFDRGAGCVRLDRLNAFLRVGLRLVPLAGGDDLAVWGFEVETGTYRRDPC